MIFEDIIKINDDTERLEKLTDWYINHTKIDDWLNSNYNKSIIQFKDRTEYKKNNKYHRINGPAIEYLDVNEDSKFFLNGQELEEKEFQKITKNIQRKIKLKKLKNTNP